MNRLEVSHLQKRYGNVTVVDDVSFHVEPGEVFGLIGPNGAGKSTSMRMIVGLLKADGGSIRFDGQQYDPRSADMRSQIGLVPQELAIYPELTALQNLRFFGKLNGLRGKRLQERVDYVLQLTGLTQNADNTLDTFSGGMARRLNFGIALLHEPKFVVLDEPTVGIDPQSRSNLLDCVRDLGKNGVGVIYASHYMEEVEAVCDRLAIIDHGHILKQGTLDELLDRSRIDLSLRVPSLPSDLADKLREYAEVSTDVDGNTSIQIHESLKSEAGHGRGDLRRVLELLESANVPLMTLKAQEKSLETLFLSLTGRTLRD